MTRILGIDFGEKRIGLAVATEKVALPFGMVAHDDQLFLKLKRICREEEVEEAVIGLPLNLDGTEGEMVQKAKSFGERLEADLGLRVGFWDERLTTQEAGEKSKDKKLADSGAAAIMLQSYLDSQN